MVKESMSPDEYRAAITKLGFENLTSFADWLGITTRTESNYSVEGPPHSVEILLRLMLFLQGMLRIHNMVGFVDAVTAEEPEKTPTGRAKKPSRTKL